MNRIESVSINCTLNAAEITDLLNSLRVCMQRVLRLNRGASDDLDYYRLTGTSSANFDQLFSCISSEIRNTSARSARTCLAILLVKLRTGLSHSILSTLFIMSKRAIGKAIHSVRIALMKCFVSMYLGLDHNKRRFHYTSY